MYLDTLSHINRNLDFFSYIFRFQNIKIINRQYIDIFDI